MKSLQLSKRSWILLILGIVIALTGIFLPLPFPFFLVASAIAIPLFIAALIFIFKDLLKPIGHSLFSARFGISICIITFVILTVLTSYLAVFIYQKTLGQPERCESLHPYGSGGYYNCVTRLAREKNNVSICNFLLSSPEPNRQYECVARYYHENSTTRNQTCERLNQVAGETSCDETTEKDCYSLVEKGVGICFHNYKGLVSTSQALQIKN